MAVQDQPGPPLRAAIIGLGWWGKTLVSASAITSKRLCFTSGVTLDPNRDAAFASAHGLTLADDLDAVLRDPDVDAVVLATPHSLHVDQIVATAEAGKPVFTEKPLALRLVDGLRAVRACRAAGVVLGLGADKRFLPAVRCVRDLVTSGELGELLHVEAQYSNDNSLRGLSGAWRDAPSEAPGGGLTGPGLHALDGLVNLAGPVRRASAAFHEHTPPPSAVDSVAALLEFESGATGLMAAVRGVPEAFRLHIVGTAGWAEVRGFDRVTISRFDGRSEQEVPGELAIGYLLDEFARAVSGESPFPISTSSMLATVAALEAVSESLRRGHPVDVASLETTGSPHSG